MTHEIHIHDSKIIKDTVVEVFYSIVDDKGIADVKMAIPCESLESFIDENDMNVFSYIIFDDYDYERQDAHEYLKDNLHETVKEYLEDKLS